MRYLRRSVMLLSLLLVISCDGAGMQTDGLGLNVIVQTSEWVLHRSDTGESWNIKDSWFKKFRCYSDRCESTFWAVPAEDPPAGCTGWKKVIEEFRIPSNYNRNETWELDEYDLQPVPRGCADKKDLKKIRNQYK